MSSSPPLPSYRRIETLEFSKSIPSSILDDICPSRLKSTSTFHAVKHTREAAKKNCLGKPILDSNHPAYPAYGLFASRKLSSLEHVIDYHGIVTLNGEEDTESDYTYSFAKRRLVIDANAVGTEARFCNDFRGIRERPNAEFFEYRDRVGDLKCGIRVKKGEIIGKGDEICVNYGKGFWLHRFGREALEKASLSTRGPRRGGEG